MTNNNVGCAVAVDSLMNTREASRWLGMCTKTLYNLTKRGEIPSIRMNAKVMYDPLDLRAYAESKKTWGENAPQQSIQARATKKASA